ncbi:MAG: hypothetical protein K0M39_09150 [Rhizobium sp.]|nr:hypothetical protein [Rhizobium sp.]
MSLLSALIQKRETRKAATAIPAIPATQPNEGAATVARIATVAVANPTEAKTENDAASWCWWLAFSETEHLIVYFHPDASRGEVLERYPGVLVAEPYDPPKASAEPDSECIEMCEF